MIVTSQTPDLERPMIDLSVTHFTRVQHGIRVQGTWIRGPEVGDAWEPVLALSRGFRMHADDTNVCLVHLDHAWAWTEESEFERAFAPHLIAEKARICARTCFLFAEQLGLTSHNNFTLMKILAVVRDHLGDLLNMPSEPPLEKVVVADAIAIGPDGKERHAEIRDYVA